MNQSPGPVGVSALSSTPTTLHFLPIFWMLPRAFSSIVVRPPAMLPLVGCDSDRSFVLLRSTISWYRLNIFMNCSRTSGVAQRSATMFSPPVISVVSPKHMVTPSGSSLSNALPTVGFEPQPEVVSDSPHLVDTQRSLIGQSSCRSSEAHWTYSLATFEARM